MRLIDADALMKVIREHDYPLRSHFNSTDNGMFTIGVQQAVDDAPTIDAAPVVRCKECGHYDTTGYPALNPGTGWCDKMDRGVHDDFYCSYGERRK